MKSRIVAVIEGHELYLRTRNGRFDLHWVDPFGGETEEQVGEDKIVAPLPGTVVALLAEEGATLEKGAPILTLEVMKMEQTLRAPFAGVLKKIKCKVGDIVGEGVELAEVEPVASCVVLAVSAEQLDRQGGQKAHFAPCPNHDSTWHKDPFETRRKRRLPQDEVYLRPVRPHHQVRQRRSRSPARSTAAAPRASSAARRAACPRSPRSGECPARRCG